MQLLSRDMAESDSRSPALPIHLSMENSSELLPDNSRLLLELYLLRYSFQMIFYLVWREKNNRTAWCFTNSGLATR
ncbi:hypothetical protein Bca4012_032888 [Brassica carinata]